jgi:hypothetical protein
MEYQFLYSKANGDFLRYLNSREFGQSSFETILEELDGVFQGVNPRLEAIRELETIVKQGTDKVLLLFLSRTSKRDWAVG